jgi:N-formylglutamate amidohydrolase
MTDGRVALKVTVMEGDFEIRTSLEPPVEIFAPATQTLPFVFASPHSGAFYPPELLSASRLDPMTLRRSEDAFVDELFAAAPSLGAPLLRARFARAYLDPNREPYELDPAMFADALPAFVNKNSPRVKMGLGTIARVVASGEEIYAHKLRAADALSRIDRLYRPYHRALRQLVTETREKFGYYLLVDCHSMPSACLGERGRPGRADIVLGDCHGTACNPAIMDMAHRALSAKGYTVARNAPYAGGFTTAHYGQPGAQGHCLQIELGRALYMDEQSFERRAFFHRLAEDMSDLILALASLTQSFAAAAE